MFKVKNHNVSLMGVMNVTPNSFSDGNTYQSKKFLEADVVDIGAESTAPGQVSVSSDEEIQRLISYFNEHRSSVNKQSILSIDTYKTQTIYAAIENLVNNGFAGKIIWNDISGVLDQDVFEFLKRFPQYFYVYNCTFVPSRADSIRHHFFSLSDEVFLTKFCEVLLKSVEKLRPYESQIYLDPGFGFSKTREQNLILFHNLTNSIEKFTSFKWLIGISRKSFLRGENTQNVKDPNVQAELDDKGCENILQILKNTDSALHFTIRIHNVSHALAFFESNKLE
jgi:dihydropteroate synthase